MIAARSSQADLSSASHKSIQTLTRFLQAIGHPTSLTHLANHILLNLSEISRYPQGTLFLFEREHRHYRQIHMFGPIKTFVAPSVMKVDHPLVLALLADQHIFDRLDATLTPHSELSENRASTLPGSYTLAVPLITHGTLIAFALLRSPTTHASLSSVTMELLTAMAQGAANALDSILIYEDLCQSQSLMRRTDRLRSLEIIAGGFAHEIRNPLTSIKTFIQLAPERKDDSQFIGEFSRIVLEDVNRIERLVQEILDYARYMEPQVTDEDLNDIVASCVYFVQVKADRRGIKIEKQLAPELPRGMLDRQQIKQVLLNLLLNALDAMGEGPGILRVRTHQFQEPEGALFMQIDIEDTGNGIEPENLEHIFDPFFTTKHSSTMNAGTGLGLTIAHQIIQEHHGNIHVTSMVGQGTTFRITLPALHQ
ncbi:MAG: GAF domain-containing protein [Nitrospira sp.]|nr:GAF domain-containing protein [Nitrospira sp.]